MFTTIILACLCALLIWKCFVRYLAAKSNLPPFPGMALPLLGHLYLVGAQVHTDLQKIYQKLRPSNGIYALYFGNKLTFVVCSSAISKEIYFGPEKLKFADRPQLHSLYQVPIVFYISTYFIVIKEKLYLCYRYRMALCETWL